MKILTLNHDGFDWDEGNTAKIEARVSLEIIQNFFKQELLIKLDVQHSFNEHRLIALGYTQGTQRCLIVAFTIRYKDKMKLIRPISARYTHRKEIEAYENEIKKLKESK